MNESCDDVVIVVVDDEIKSISEGNSSPSYTPVSSFAQYLSTS